MCPDWLCCDWSHDSIKLIETWTDYRIISAIILYACVIRCFMVAPRSVYLTHIIAI